MREPVLRGMTNRLLQVLALYAPGARTVRPWLHKRRGVAIDGDVFIGTDALIETAFPRLVSIGDDVEIGVRCVLIAHFRDMPPEAVRGPHGGFRGIRLEDHTFVGPGAVILPNVTIGRGAVVMAGSVVSRSVPPMTVVQGNPAAPVARCGIPLGSRTPAKEFYRALKPLGRSGD